MRLENYPQCATQCATQWDSQNHMKRATKSMYSMSSTFSKSIYSGFYGDSYKKKERLIFKIKCSEKKIKSIETKLRKPYEISFCISMPTNL